MHSDAKGSLLDLLPHFIFAIESLVSALLGLRDDFFVCLVSASTVLAFVLVGCVGLGANLARHSPVCAHPATVAAFRFSVTVDSLLFRDPDDWLASLDGLHGLLHQSGSEGPA